MAVEFTQNYGTTHTCLYIDSAVTNTFPFVFIARFNTGAFTTRRHLVAIYSKANAHYPARAYFLNIHGGSTLQVVAQEWRAKHLVEQAFSATTGTFDQWHVGIARFLSSGMTASLDGTPGTANTGVHSGLSVNRTSVGGVKLDFNATTTFGLIGCECEVGIINRDVTPEEEALIVAGARLGDVFEADEFHLYWKGDDEATALTTEVGDDFTLETAPGSDGIGTCPTSPDFTGEPEPEPEPPGPTPAVTFVPNRARLLKPYEKPPIAVFKVR